MGVFLGSTQHLDVQNYHWPLWHQIQSENKQTNQPKKKTQNQENRNHSLPVGHQLAQLPGSAQRQEDEIHLGQVQESL